jgi:hypothetical protein
MNCSSDPFCVVTKLAEGASRPVVLGKTEVIKNTLSPDWTKVFVFDFELGHPVHIAISVYDEVRKGSNKAMGSAKFELGGILGAMGNVKAKKMKRGGTIFAHVEKYTGSGILRLALQGTKLKNTEGMFNKSDPFFEVKRKVPGPSGDVWDVIYRSQHIPNDLNPRWADSTIDLAALCGGNLEQHIQISVYDHEKSGKHVLMGEIETSVRELVAAKDSGPFILRRNGKDKGRLSVNRADLIGMEDLSTQVAGMSLSGGASAPPLPMPVPVPVPAPASSSGAYVPGSAPAYVPGSAHASAPPAAGSPTFVDYISGGCQLNLCVAIDFTGSNGDPRKPGTLHYIHPNGSPNDYEKAIQAIGRILAKYDYDQKFPVLGFGAKYGGIVRHCFQAGATAEVDGVDGIVQAYRSVFRTGLIMSGPTVFTEVMQTAAAHAISSQEEAKRNDKQAYTVLLILTDGAVSDVHATAECLKQISDSPVSIVIVGVGAADFSAMQFLDDCAARGTPDIAQFVEFNRHRHDRLALTAATLDEIPDQLVGYFTRKGIHPARAVHLDEEEVVVEPEEEEIDLSLAFGNDGEINVASGGQYNSSMNF